MRFSFVVALAIVTGSVFFCLYAESLPGGADAFARGSMSSVTSSM
jgi:hypothetical protein